MVVLNIFNMDDVQNENVIASLTNGTHVIGRGDLLNVRDKRVSRKHAVIEVSDDNVTLTSAHVNPCFFQAAQGKTLTIINKDHTNELGDGDRFGLLPDSLWFKVRLINKLIPSIDDINDELGFEYRLERNQEPDTTADVTADQIEENISIDAQAESSNIFKRHGTDEVEEEHDTKKARFNNDEEPTTSNNITNNHMDTDNHIDKDNHIDTENHQKLIDLQPKEVEIPQIPASPTESLNLRLDEDDIFNEGASQTEKNNSANSISNEVSRDEEEINTSANLNETAEMVDPSNEEAVGNVDAENVVTEIKQEELSIPNSQQSLTSQNAEVKQEPSGSDDGTKEVKTEPPDGDGQGSNANNAASGSGPKKTRREKCWYAERCFRKNPHHRETFSHPGDQDYNSDPEDDRPDCPFGASCYRRNIEHRQEYKHSNRPAPKPSNNPVNVQVNLQRGCPFCDHCNKRKSGGGGGGKSGYESDPYDDFDDEGIF